MADLIEPYAHSLDTSKLGCHTSKSIGMREIWG